MPLQLYVQVNIIFYAFLAGLLIGVLFDLYRELRGYRVNKGIMFLEDILFWILGALIVFVFLLYMNYAFLGPYVYLFISISTLIYYRHISQYFRRLEKGISVVVRMLFRIIIKNICYPFKIVISRIRIKNKWKAKNDLNKRHIMFTI